MTFNRAGGGEIDGISVVMPAFNEELAVRRQIEGIRAALCRTGRSFEIIVVDDGSTDETAARAAEADVRLLRRDRNYGYGAALKAGIAEARFDWILIVDADGTYPPDAVPRMLDHLPAADMVVGARAGEVVPMRRLPKWLLRQYASLLVGRRIPDLNSGMRIMRRTVLHRFLDLLPSGFSFTTTITLAMLSNGHNVVYTPIDYFKRIGKSKIHAVEFFRIFARITRLMLVFRPVRLLVPALTILLFLGVMAYRNGLWPAHFPAVALASMSCSILALGGLVEYRSHQLKMMRPEVVARTAASRGMRVVASMALLLSLLLFLPRDRLFSTLRLLDPRVVAAVVPLLLLVQVVGSWKWHLVVNEAGAGLRFPSSVRIYFTGIFGNLFLPSIVGGDAVMIAMGLRETRSRGAIIAGSLISRLLDFAALMTIAFVGAIALGSAVGGPSRRWLVILAVAALVAALLLTCAFIVRPERLPGKLRAIYLRHQPLFDALRRPRTYAAPFLLGVLVQFCFLVLTAWIAEVCGVHISITVWLLAWPLAKFVALAPITAGGIGAREVALAALLAPFGVAAGSAIAIGLAWDGVLIVGNLFAGVISRVLAAKAVSPSLG